jgi:hypothetical protein
VTERALSFVPSRLVEGRETGGDRHVEHGIVSGRDRLRVLRHEVVQIAAREFSRPAQIVDNRIGELSARLQQALSPDLGYPRAPSRAWRIAGKLRDFDQPIKDFPLTRHQRGALHNPLGPERVTIRRADENTHIVARYMAGGAGGDLG